MTKVHKIDAEANGVQTMPNYQNGELDGHNWPSHSNGFKKATNRGKGANEEHGKKEEEEVEEDEDPGTFKEALLDICENSSFQGMKYVVADTPFTIRR